jgi:hypothetical protein
LWLVNGNPVDATFRLPAGVWQSLLDTAHPRGVGVWRDPGDHTLVLPARSLQVLGAAGHGIDL